MTMAESKPRLVITAVYYNDKGEEATETVVKYKIMTKEQSAIVQKTIADALCGLGIKSE
jgi:hypothetical protein